jgi:hypothetical protein
MRRVWRMLTHRPRWIVHRTPSGHVVKLTADARRVLRALGYDV